MKKQKVEKLSELTKSEGTDQSSLSQKNSLFLKFRIRGFEIADFVTDFNQTVFED